MTAIGLDGIDEILPLTPAQSGMLLDVLRGDAPRGTYCGLIRFTLDGALDAARFASALRDTADAHDVFQLSFEWEGLKQPVQLMHRKSALVVDIEDWTGRGSRELEARLHFEQDNGFDLRLAPLSRAIIFRLAENRHVVAWLLHHLIVDGWSAGVLLNEVMDRYAMRPVVEAAPFRDLLEWHAERSDGHISAEETFFTSYLSGIEPPVLPGVGLRDGSGAPRSADRITVPVDPLVDKGANELARRLRVTPATLLSTVFAIQLRRYGVGDDVMVGEANAGRPEELPNVAKSVGPFVNTLPMRLRLMPDESVSDLIRRAGKDANARRPHALASLADLKSWSGLRSGAPLFRIPFVYEGLPSVQGQLPSGLSMSEIDFDAPGPDAMAFLYFPGEHPSLRIYSDPRFHDPGAVADFGAEYAALLEKVIQSPDMLVSAVSEGLQEVPAVEPVERTDFPTIPEAIMTMAAQFPDAVAVRCGDDTATYRELMQRANEFALALQSHNIGSGDVVPLAVGRSVDAIAAMIGVMLRGSAYVTLDLDYPEARLRDILDIIGARMIVTRSQDEDRIAWADLTKVFPLAGAREPVDQAVLTNEMAAYVLFTSGSQGKPKGVRVTHGNLSYSTGVRTQVYGSDPKSFLVLSPLGFDSSVAGIYWTLSTGGELLLSPPNAERDIADLSRIIDAQKPSHMLCLPGLYQLLLDQTKSRHLVSVDTVIVAGEPLSPNLIDLHRRHGRGRLFNEYGPTEATVWCTSYDTSLHGGSGEVPIGRPIPGTAIAIVDPDGAPLPDGSIGEIEVIGPGVAEGYVNDELATSRVFRSKYGQRTYRTGDIGIRLPDSTVLFRGRADAQVKIRGHRVEPSEVEAALGQIKGLGEAVVVCEPIAEGARLVAFVERCDPAEIREALLSRLPGYLVPSRIIVVPDMPRLPNGKIDRRQLAARSAEHTETEAQDEFGFVMATLAEIWAELLECEQVRPEDDFFELGGDSLLAMRMVFAAESAGLPIAAHEVFENPVLAQLAAHIEAAVAEIRTDPDFALRAHLNSDGRGQPFLMIHGSPEMCAHLGSALGRETPLVFQYSRFLRGEPPWSENVDTMVDDLKKIADELFRDGPVRIGGYSLGGVLAIELARRIREERGVDPFVFLLDPSWETASSPMPIVKRHAVRLRSFAMACLHDAWRKLNSKTSERHRISAVGNIYRSILLAHAPQRYDAPVRLLTSAEGAILTSRESWLTRTCPIRVDGRVEAGHLDLQTDRNALFAWTSALARALNEGEP